MVEKGVGCGIVGLEEWSESDLMSTKDGPSEVL